MCVDLCMVNDYVEKNICYATGCAKSVNTITTCVKRNVAQSALNSILIILIVFCVH